MRFSMCIFLPFPAAHTYIHTYIHTYYAPTHEPKKRAKLLQFPELNKFFMKKMRFFVILTYLSCGFMFFFVTLPAIKNLNNRILFCGREATET